MNELLTEFAADLRLAANEHRPHDPALYYRLQRICRASRGSAPKFVEGVLWIVRTGSPWRDLHEVFGDWNTVFRRFSRWRAKGVWWRIFEAPSLKDRWGAKYPADALRPHRRPTW
jgi:transposase